MRDMILTVVTLLVLALGASVILLLRRVGHIATQIREAEQRRATKQAEAVAEVKRILAGDGQPPGDGGQPRRRHLKALPVFAGLLAGPLALARWAADYPLQAATTATVSTAAVVAVLVTPADQPSSAAPAPPPPPIAQAPDLNKPPRHPEPPARPQQQRHRTARPRVVAAAPAIMTAAEPPGPPFPASSEPVEPPPADPPPATDPPPDEPPPPDAQPPVAVRIEALGLVVQLRIGGRALASLSIDPIGA